MTTSDQFAGGENLDNLLRSYRQATELDGSAIASPHFMPELWQRIEARRSNSFSIERFARVFATATVALAVFAGLVATFIPQGPLEDTWVEALANNHLAQNTGYYEPVRLAPPAPADAPTNAEPGR